LADCRAAAEAEGREVVAEYSDEAASAFKGNRGAGLTAAKDAAITAGAELWVQHSDRLARGDGITADHLAKVWFALRRNGVRLRSVQDDSNLEDAIRVVLIGERNHEDSKRKVAATRAGLKRRADRGEPVGAISEGYCVQATIRDSQARNEPVIDERRQPIVERIFGMVEDGRTFGDVARALNADRVKTRRGKTFSTRGVREIVLNEDYTGTTGYPVLVDRERWEGIIAGLTRLTARETGRRPAEPRLLRGIGNCRCGQALYTRALAAGRVYICAAVREARGTSNAAKIPANLADRAVIVHLGVFIKDIEGWIAERAAQASDARAEYAKTLDAQRAELRTLTVRAERAREEYAKLLDAGDDLATDALREAARMDRDARGLQEALQAAQQRLEAWPSSPQVDALLDYYTRLHGVLAGRLNDASTIDDANAVLRSLLDRAELWCEDGTLHGHFHVRSAGAGVIRTQVK
jgi:Resolvase, N terminal domain/Recombinase